MHIIYVTPEFVTDNAGGGLATYLANISRIMAEHGHEVSVVTLSRNHNDCIQWQDHVTVYRVLKDDRCPIVPFRLMKHSLDLNRKVKKLLRNRKADIIQYASFEAVGLFHAVSTPCTVRISSDPLTWRVMKLYNYTENDLRNACFTDRLEYIAEKRIRNIFGPGRAVGSIIHEHTGIEPQIIESPYHAWTEEDDKVYREKLAGKKYFLAHSSMSCFKGTHVIAEAISGVCGKDPDAWFVFAGDDHGIPYKNGTNISAKEYILKCAGQFRDRVIFLGTLDRKYLTSIIKNAFACLMPSRLDNMPNTCIEALSMGKIVIGTKNSGFEQLIVSGENGFLIEPDDAAGMEAAIEKLNKMTDLERDRMMAAAKATTERFSPEHTYEKTVDYYNRVISNYGNRIRRTE